MPRNSEENVYVTIGFPHRSGSWQRLQQEANELDISVAYLIKVLLADRAAALEGHSRHLWFPREFAAQTQPALPPPSSAPQAAVGDDASRRVSAAAAAANYWDD
jgi:hypothetical protein